MEAPGRRVALPCQMARQAGAQLARQGVLHLLSAPIVPCYQAAAIWREGHGKGVGAAEAQLASGCHSRFVHQLAQAQRDASKDVETATRRQHSHVLLPLQCLAHWAEQLGRRGG